MSNETMTYSAWRATFQSGEQAAKSAFDDAKRNFNERQKLALVVEDLARQVGALSAQRDELLEMLIYLEHYGRKSGADTHVSLDATKELIVKTKAQIEKEKSHG